MWLTFAASAAVGEDLGTLNERAAALIRDGRAKEAAAAYESAPPPSDPDERKAFLYSAAIASRTAGDATAARRWLVELVERDPFFGRAADMLATSIAGAPLADTAAILPRATRALAAAGFGESAETFLKRAFAASDCDLKASRAVAQALLFFFAEQGLTEVELREEWTVPMQSASCAPLRQWGKLFDELHSHESSHILNAASQLYELEIGDSQAVQKLLGKLRARDLAAQRYSVAYERALAAIATEGKATDAILDASYVLSVAPRVGNPHDLLSRISERSLPAAERVVLYAQLGESFEQRGSHYDAVEAYAHAVGSLDETRAPAPRLRQKLAVLQRQLEREASMQPERDQLRLQLATTEAQFRLHRDARIAAERSLDDFLRRYEAAVAHSGASSPEVESLRRQVEDQSLALQSIQARELQSEASLADQVSSLESALQRDRIEGRLTEHVLAQRENALRTQRHELARARAEREESDRRRIEAELARAAAIAEAEHRRAEAEAEAALLRQQVAQTASALEDARSEIARRDAASQAQISTMQQELARLVETRETERGLIATLPGLFFETGKAALKPGARNTLSRVAEQLSAVASARITIEGHTDSVGSEELNQRLSERRAAAVRDYLISRGIAATRLTVIGVGEAMPVASNDTPSGRHQNRRVELVIQQ